jgi:hypothetical protein
LYSDYERGEILVISLEGHLTILKLNEFIKWYIILIKD